MAISTYKVFLMKKTSDTWSKLIDIKDFPDLGGSPELLETTTLSDKMQTYIPGIQSLDALEFTANYTKTDYTTLKALEGEDSAGVVTPTGIEGKFSFKGALSVYASGGGVNEVVDMTITIAPSTPITMDTE